MHREAKKSKHFGLGLPRENEEMRTKIMIDSHCTQCIITVHIEDQ